MELLFPVLFLCVLGFILFLNVITLPANWIMLGCIGLWRFLYPNPGDMSGTFFLMLIGLALFGELIEYITQGWGSKKYGSSTSGMWAGLLGALVGALLGLPFFFGLGALFGALAGAWVGCYIMEMCRGRSAEEAKRAAMGALVGRFLGLVIKFGIGAIMLGLTFHALFDRAPLPQISTF